MKTARYKRFSGRSVILAAVMALMPSLSFADYVIVFQGVKAPGATESVDPVQKSIESWNSLAESIGKTPPDDWSNGIGLKRGCCGTHIESLPAEKYPSSIINGGLSFHNHSMITDISSLSEITLIDGDLNLVKTSVSSLVPLRGTEITGHIKLSYTGLSSLEGLESVTNMKYFTSSENNLTNLNGLQNVVSIGNVYLRDNNLNDISAFSSLKSFGYNGYINLSGNPNLEDLSPLNGATSFTKTHCSSLCSNFIVDNRPYTTKMSSSSVICQEINSNLVNLKDNNGNAVPPEYVCDI